MAKRKSKTISLEKHNEDIRILDEQLRHQQAEKMRQHAKQLESLASDRNALQSKVGHLQNEVTRLQAEVQDALARKADLEIQLKSRPHDPLLVGLINHLCAYIARNVRHG